MRRIEVAVATLAAAFGFGAYALRFAPSTPALGSASVAPATAGLAARAVHVEEVWTTERERGGALGAVVGMAETGDGRVWVSDAGTGAVSAFTPGRGATVVARRGAGPGEVRAPGLLARTPEGGVAMHDPATGEVSIFGADGRFSRRVRLARLVQNPKGFVVTAGGEMVLTGGVSGEAGSIHRFRKDGRLARSWHPAPRTRNPRAGQLVAGGPVSAGPDGRLLFSQAAPHRIVAYDAAGTPRELAADPALLRPVGDDFIREEDGRRTFRWFFPQSKGVFELPGGRVLNVVWFRDEGYTLWEMYDAAGRRLARTRLERAYEPWALTPDGRHVLASYLHPDTDEPVAARLSVTLR